MLQHNIRNLIIVLVIAGLMNACAARRAKPSATDMRDEIIKTALSLKGIVYKKNGKGPEGFDCSGFVYYVFKKSNISLSPSTSKLVQYGQPISRDKVQPGDLVFFKVKKIFHVGIMLNHEEFIHSSTRKGVTIDRLDSPYWGKKSIHFRSVL